MKGLVILLCFIMVSNINSYSQREALDVELIFKLHIYLDYKNTHFEALRNDSLLNILLVECELVLEKVEIRHNRFVSYPPEFEVYKMLSYSFKNEIGYYSAMHMHESHLYIIAVNKISGRSYRLRGFNSNDFVHFFNDYKILYNYRNRNVTNRELKNLLSIDGLDIDCLFRSIGQIDRDVNKFPCLRNRNDAVIIR